MTAVLTGGNIEEEFVWSCSLTGSNKEYVWEPATLEPEQENKEEGEEGSKVKPSHRLLIKTAILSPTAKKDEVTVVEIETEGYKEKKVRFNPPLSTSR